MLDITFRYTTVNELMTYTHNANITFINIYHFFFQLKCCCDNNYIIYNVGNLPCPNKYISDEVETQLCEHKFCRFISCCCWIKYSQNVNGEADTLFYIYHTCMHRRHKCWYLPNMLTYLLVLFLGIYYLVKRCFPCENLTLNVGYYFQIYYSQ